MQRSICVGRIAKVNGIRHFGNGKNRFYIAYRCTNECLPDSVCCRRCIDRGTDKIQSSGKFNHGLVTDPIPDHSHMYGGKWYKDGCIAWGTPSAEALQIAEQEHQATIANTIVAEDSSDDDDVRPKIVRPGATTVAPIVAVATVAAPVVTETKPKIKRSYSKKTTKVESVAIPAIQHIHATHIEQEMNEIYVDDYEVEHVSLSPFEHNGTMYYREPNKNKLFEQVKSGIGAYIGRYDSYTDTVRNDIPDSDEE